MRKSSNTDSSNQYYLIGILAITFFAYLPALRNGLVADSWVFVYPHSFAETLRYFYTSIIPPEWEAYWLRPVPMLFFWIDGILWPDTAWGPHLTNVIFHCVNVWLIWTIMTFFCNTSSSHTDKIDPLLPAAVASLVYGLHPLTVGSVGWVAARFDVMGVTLGLLGLQLWLKWDSGNHSLKGIFAFALIFFTGLLTKEQSIIFIAVSFVHGIYGITRKTADHTAYRNALIILTLTVALYLLYRISVFHGLGGYLQSSGTLNPAIPFYFLAAILFPFTNIFTGWSLSPFFLLSAISVLVMAGFLVMNPRRSYGLIRMHYILIATALSVFGIASTAPHAGMLFSDIFGHAESRFTLIAITGLSLLAGSITVMATRSLKGNRIAVILLVIWSVPALWRTDVQLQAWHHAGNTASQIISLAVSEAHDPPPHSIFYFLNIPRENKQYAYIFGIGLKEAILRYFPGRDDIRIIPKASGKHLRNAIPERDFVFGFNDKTGRLERLFLK